jgi:hypothetical protein
MLATALFTHVRWYYLDEHYPYHAQHCNARRILLLSSCSIALFNILPLSVVPQIDEEAGAVLGCY